jgi:hypothetical protein
METTQQPIKAQLQQVLTELKKLGGEVRLQIHLGNMDLKKAWDEIEPKLADADQLAEKASEDAYDTVRDMLRKVKHIHTQLPRKG